MERDVEKSDRAGHMVVFAVLAGGVVLTPVLYVLSVGPAIWLNRLGYLPDDVGVVYYPIAWLAEVFDPFNDLVAWYASLWE